MVSATEISKLLNKKQVSDTITDPKTNKQFSFYKVNDSWDVNLDQLKTNHGKPYVYRRALIGEINLKNPELAILHKDALKDILSKQIARKINDYLKDI